MTRQRLAPLLGRLTRIAMGVTTGLTTRRHLQDVRMLLIKAPTRGHRRITRLHTHLGPMTHHRILAKVRPIVRGILWRLSSDQRCLPLSPPPRQPDQDHTAGKRPNLAQETRGIRGMLPSLVQFTPAHTIPEDPQVGLHMTKGGVQTSGAHGRTRGHLTRHHRSMHRTRSLMHLLSNTIQELPTDPITGAHTTAQSSAMKTARSCPEKGPRSQTTWFTVHTCPHTTARVGPSRIMPRLIDTRLTNRAHCPAKGLSSTLL